MTVYQLVEALNTCHPDLPVIVETPHGFYTLERVAQNALRLDKPVVFLESYDYSD